MKKLGVIFAIGFGLVSCRQASFIAEDDVYSPSTGYMAAAAGGSDASYSTYVYSQQGSGTKSAYYTPSDTTQQANYDTRQQGTTVVNNYYGHDPIYSNGWHGYGAFGYPVRGFHNPWRYNYRSRWVWYGWGYDPFFYGFHSPWNSWCGYGPSWGYGWGYGWGHNPYMYGYNPYAWGHGFGHNPYGWGGGNTIINGNVYNFYGNQGMTTGSGSNMTGSGLIQSGNSFIGKRPATASQTTPYSGINKSKSALDANGKPKEVKDISAMRASNDKIQAAKQPVTSLRNEPKQASAQRAVSSQQLTASSRPWTPETTAPAAQPRQIDGQKQHVQPSRQGDQIVNRPSVPNRPAAEQSTRPTAQPAVSPSRPTSNPRVEPVTPQTNPNNQWNRNATPQNRQVSPNPAPRQQMSNPQPSRPSGGSMNNSPSRPSGGSMNSPSRSGGSFGGGGSSRPSSGGSVGGSRGGRP